MANRANREQYGRGRDSERSGDGPGEWEGDGEEKRVGPTTEDRLSGQWSRERQGGQYGGGEMGGGQWGRERRAASMAVRGAATVEELPPRTTGAGVASTGVTRTGIFCRPRPEGLSAFRPAHQRGGSPSFLTRDPEVDPGDVEVTVTGGALRHDT